VRILDTHHFNVFQARAVETPDVAMVNGELVAAKNYGEMIQVIKEADFIELIPPIFHEEVSSPYLLGHSFFMPNFHLDEEEMKQQNDDFQCGSTPKIY